MILAEDPTDALDGGERRGDRNGHPRGVQAGVLTSLLAMERLTAFVPGVVPLKLRTSVPLPPGEIAAVGREVIVKTPAAVPEYGVIVMSLLLPYASEPAS